MYHSGTGAIGTERGATEAKSLPTVDPLNISHNRWVEEVEFLKGLLSADSNVPRHARAEALGLLQFNLDVNRVGGNTVRMVARCHDLKPDSLKFIHSRYMHVGASVVCWMRHAANGLTPIRGTVQNCEFARGVVHVSTLHLDDEIDVSDYLACPPEVD
ncbi:MAG: hypothetical protein AAF711_13930 [Planctomycetota bacterium]